MRKRVFATLLAMVMAVGLLAPISVTASTTNNEVPLLEINTRANTAHASAGDIIEVEVTLNVLSDVGVDSGFIRLYYDSARLEFIRQPQNRLVEVTVGGDEYSVGGHHLLNPNRISLVVSNRNIPDPAFGDLAFIVQFRVRDDAPLGEATITQNTTSGFVGYCADVNLWNPLNMPVISASPVARVNITPTPMLEINTRANTAHASAGDIIEVEVTLDVLTDVGVDFGFIRLYYDSARLELIRQPQNRVTIVTVGGDQYSVGGQQLLNPNRLSLTVSNRYSGHNSPAFGDLAFIVQFRVKDDAPLGEATITQNTVSGFAGYRINGNPWNPLGMPVISASPVARVNIVG